MAKRFNSNEYRPNHGGANVFGDGNYPTVPHPDTTPNKVGDGYPWKIGDPNLPKPTILEPKKPWFEDPDEGGTRVPRKPKPSPSSPPMKKALDLPRQKAGI